MTASPLAELTYVTDGPPEETTGPGGVAAVSGFNGPAVADVAFGPGDEQPVDEEVDDENVLFGISFDTPLRAQEFLAVLTRMNRDRTLRLKDAVVVTKDDQGSVRVRESIDPQPGQSALSGAMWSGLLGLIIGGPVGWIAGMGVGAGIGALSARVIDLGIPDDWVTWFKEAVLPGTATVVVLAAEVDIDGLVVEAKRFAGAELIHATLAPGALAQLARALAGPSAPPESSGPSLGRS
jgi:uncharacterized membrane protein